MRKSYRVELDGIITHSNAFHGLIIVHNIVSQFLLEKVFSATHARMRLGKLFHVAGPLYVNEFLKQSNGARGTYKPYYFNDSTDLVVLSYLQHINSITKISGC